tara:strand:- start:324 stop:2615 length:2292 start_codon:yes stop_codon:yes gene_type:complete
MKKFEKDDNYFDNKVVIIDEVHNFINTIANKMKMFNNDKHKLREQIQYKLYNMLLNAKNCKLVFLTGTPIINKPHEIGILFNMLRGIIKIYKFNMILKKGIDDSKFEKILKKRINKIDKTIDYLEYRNKVIKLTRIPYGFKNVFNKNGDILGVIKTNNPESYKNDKEFINNFIKEIKKKYNNKKNKIIKKITFPIPKAENNFESNPTLSKALPDNFKDFNKLFLDNRDEYNVIIKNENYFKTRIVGLASYYKSPNTILMPRINLVENIEPDKDIKDIKIEKIFMSDYQFKIYVNKRHKERTEKKPKNIYEKSSQTYKSGTRAFCNFVFPEVLLNFISSGKRPRPADNNIDSNIYEKTIVKEKDKKHIVLLEKLIKHLNLNTKDSVNYLSDENLREFSPKFLKIYKNIQQSNGSNLLYSSFRTAEGIEIFSKVLESMGRNYTNFEVKSNTIGKKKNWVLANSTKEKLDMIKNDIDGVFTLENNPFYMIFSGTEKKEKKELLRLIFNGDWKNLPDYANDIKTYLINNFSQYIDKEHNNYSKFIKLFMISSSGAEGISLKNTRYVHIMEPYWNPVRIDQIIGRARRICSHDGLKEELRNISVYLYLMKFTENQKNTNDEKYKNIVEKDNYLTTDETLWELSKNKKNINDSILNLIKEACIDCNNNLVEQGTICYKQLPGKNYNNPQLIINENIDNEENEKIKKVKYIKHYIGKKAYIKIKEENKDKIDKKFLLNKTVYTIANDKEKKLGIIIQDEDGKIKVNKRTQ